MVEEDDSSNIEWEQDKGFSKNTRVSRRLDLKKALAAENSERTSFKSGAKKLKHISPNLKRLRTKIRDVYDDEEDDEENEVVFHFGPEDTGSSLLSALKDEEKAKLQVKQTLDNQKMQQTAGKMEAIMAADKMSKQLGLKGVKKKIINTNINDVAVNSQILDKTIAEDIALKTKIKTEGLSSKETSDMVKGLRKVKMAAVQSDEVKVNIFETMKTEDLIKIGKAQDDKKTAKMILEKSGRKESSVKNETAKEKARQQQKIKEAIKQKGKSR